MRRENSTYPKHEGIDDEEGLQARYYWFGLHPVFFLFFLFAAVTARNSRSGSASEQTVAARRRRVCDEPAARHRRLQPFLLWE